MRDAIIGLFPGEVLKDRNTEVETNAGAAEGQLQSRPIPSSTGLGVRNYTQHGNALAVGTVG